MTKEQVKRILDRVPEWPLDRPADLAEIAIFMEAQDKSGIGLTEDQVEEVERRLSEANPKTISLAELNERLRRRYAYEGRLSPGRRAHFHLDRGRQSLGRIENGGADT
jgi:hypothetical protein